jgi:hypothetical protein
MSILSAVNAVNLVNTVNAVKKRGRRQAAWQKRLMKSRLH